MSSLYYLAKIVECVTPRKSKFIKNGDANHTRDNMAQENSQWMRVIICIIQIVEYLTNLQARFDFQPLFEGGGNRQPTLSLSEAKGISDSGLFREMLSLYTATRTEKETMNTEQPIATDVVRMQLLRTIFMLSIHSLDVLGQFAVRVPDFVNEIHSSEFMSNNLVDGILWASLGSCLLEKAAGAVNVPRLKVLTKSKSNSVAISSNTISLAGYVVLGFEALCNSTIKALQSLKRCIQSSEDVGRCDEHRKEYDACLAALADIRLISKCFSACPCVTEMLMDVLGMEGDEYSESKKRFTELKSILKNISTHTEEEIDIISPTGHKKDDDAKSIELLNELDPKVQTMKQFRKDYRATVGSVRLYVKVVSLALESQKGSGLLLDKSSKTD
jgi:predicted metal-binding transcription factor (methanogenesis marker protein 9)